MSNVLLHRKALILRKQKKSYSQIKSILGVSKSTLSEWLRAYPLTRGEINNLRANSEIRIEKYRQTMRNKREAKLAQYRKEEKQKLLPLSKRELLIAGLFLYWGEGAKVSRNLISINNTDPKLVQFALYWMKRALGIPKNKIQVYLHLYNDMNIQEEITFWSKVLKIPLRQFSKPYIKDSKRSDLDQKGFGHGTCGVRACNTILKDRMLIGIDVIAQHYVRKLS
jgi:DNA-binding transcriptional ArsR family regulator